MDLGHDRAGADLLRRPGRPDDDRRARHQRAATRRAERPVLDCSIGGLPKNTAFTLAEWNATGDGKISIVGTVDTGPAGVARFSVPLTAAFVLTTVPMS